MTEGIPYHIGKRKSGLVQSETRGSMEGKVTGREGSKSRTIVKVAGRRCPFRNKIQKALDTERGEKGRTIEDRKG